MENKFSLKLKTAAVETKRIIDFAFKLLANIYSFILSALFLILCLLIGLLPIVFVVGVIVKYVMWLF